MHTPARQSFSGTGQLGLSELTAAYRASSGYRTRVTSVSVLGAMSALVFALVFALPWWQALSVLVLVLFSAWRLPARLARGRLRRGGAGPWTFELSDAGIYQSDPERRLPWSALHGLEQTDAAYVVDVAGELPLVLPKGAFEKDALPAVRLLLETHVQPAPAAWPRVAVAVLIALAVALVWFVARRL